MRKLWMVVLLAGCGAGMEGGDDAPAPAEVAASQEGLTVAWNGTCSIFTGGTWSYPGNQGGWMDYGCSGSFTDGTNNGSATAEIWLELWQIGGKVMGSTGHVTETTTSPNIPGWSELQISGDLSWALTPGSCWRAAGKVTWDVGPPTYQCSWCGWYPCCSLQPNRQTASWHSANNCL